MYRIKLFTCKRINYVKPKIEEWSILKSNIKYRVGISIHDTNVQSIKKQIQEYNKNTFEILGGHHEECEIWNIRNGKNH